MMKKLTNSASAWPSPAGKTLFGGSLVALEATGYSLLYFVEAMLAHRGQSLGGHAGPVSGSGSVAQYAIEKGDGPRRPVITASDSGTVHPNPDGHPRSWPV